MKKKKDSFSAEGIASVAYDMFEPRTIYGQGKSVIAILTEDGCTYPVISHEAKFDGNKRNSFSKTGIKKGERPMHQSTLSIARFPYTTDYTTTNNQVGMCAFELVYLLSVNTKQW